MGHLRNNGFQVETRNTTPHELNATKVQYGVPPALSSCHTGEVDGYIVEGHVPADVLKRFLAERPDAVGLAVAGMPMGSPGMDGPRAEPYDVMAFDKNGKSWVYARK